MEIGVGSILHRNNKHRRRKLDPIPERILIIELKYLTAYGSSLDKKAETIDKF